MTKNCYERYIIFLKGYKKDTIEYIRKRLFKAEEPPIMIFVDQAVKYYSTTTVRSSLRISSGIVTPIASAVVVLMY